MKTILTLIAASSLLAALAVAQTPRYTVTDLGTLGGAGTNSTAFEMNNAGWVAGSSNLTSGGPQHAFLWYGGGPLRDLGTLDGPVCPACNSGADGPNASGEAAIGSETSQTDPNGEDFSEGWSSSQRLLIAIHEAGHIVVAAKYGCELKTAWVRPHVRKASARCSEKCLGRGGDGVQEKQ